MSPLRQVLTAAVVRAFTDDVINHRLSFLSKGDIPPTSLQPHADTLGEFPAIGNPHPS